MNPHPTQIFLHNPKALRVECRLDDEALDLWWSPRAGESWDCADRNFANRDNPLTVFEQIRLPGCNLGQFVRCDYDAYHVAIHFKEQVLHLALRHDAPVLILWTEKPQRVDFKTARYDEATEQTAQAFAVRHAEPAYSFDFVARMGVGTGHFRHSEVHAKWNSHYSQALLAGGQVLLIGVGLSDADGIAGQVEQLCKQSPQEHLIAVDSALAPIEATGQVVAPERPEWERLRRSVVRGLHSIIDESGAMRASIKNVYYLIWVRDGGFGFPYQAAAGLPLRLAEFCRLLMENPTTVRGKQVPHGRMFGQLINKD